MQDFDMTLEHRKGSRMEHVDALSRGEDDQERPNCKPTTSVPFKVRLNTRNDTANMQHTTRRNRSIKKGDDEQSIGNR